MKPCIDIVMATFNGSAYLEEQISSVRLNTGYHELVNRFIIVDDGSADQTLKVLAKFAAADRKIEIISNKGGARGTMENFAHGIAHSSAEYVILADQDDYWIEHKLIKLYHAIMLQTQNYGSLVPLMTFSDMRVVDAELGMVASSYWHMQHINPEWCHSLKKLLVQNIVPGCAMIFNRALVQKAIPLPPGAIMHDWWLTLMACIYGHINFISEPLLLYRQHQGNQIGIQGLRRWLSNGISSALLSGRLRVYALSGQARAIATLDMGKGLRSEDQMVLTALVSLPELSVWRRIWMVLNGTVRKNTLIRNLAMVALLCFSSPSDDDCTS